jgi:hypothetical protein
MSVLARIGIFAFGLLVIWQGKTQLMTGHWAFTNLKGQLMFGGSVMGGGFILCALAFLPPSKWTYKHITTGRKSKDRKKGPFA